jgi:hypothetical protein
MNILVNKNRTTIIQILIVIGFACISFSSCSEKSMDGKIIITRVAGKIQNANILTGDSWRYISKAQIVVLDPNKDEGSLKVLTTDYFSAQSPAISYDGKFLLFAGQLKENDLWQIWEMDLGNLKTRQLTSSNENCTDPVYLPNGNLLYSRSDVNDSLKAGHSLYVCKLDGSENKRITFNPSTYFASNVLVDGRVLTISKQLFPQIGDQMFTILRPDGTKAEIFYKGDLGSTLITKGMEISDGKIVFIESVNTKTKGGRLVSISYNRPLHSRIDLSPEISGDFLSVSAEPSGKLLVSYRKSDSEKYSLYEYDLQNKVLGKTIYSSPEYDVLDAIVIEKKVIPKKLPSEVDMGVKTGLLLCQDINVTDMQGSGDTFSIPIASGIEILGLDSSLGTVKVEEDGSFYLKVMADKPFRIQTIDTEGHIIHGPGSWIWLRPNERRGCVGCHEDSELVPQNKVPLSVKNSPVIIPVHINKVVEKNVLLE